VSAAAFAGLLFLPSDFRYPAFAALIFLAGAGMGLFSAHGVPHAIAHEIGQAPPVASLFAAFLGYNPVHQLLSPTGVLAHLPADQVSVLTGKQFFPELISGPFHHGLVIVFSTAIVLLVIAAGVSLLRGGRYVYEEHAAAAATTAGQVAANGAQPVATGAQPAPTATDGQAASSNRQPATDGQPAAKGGPPVS
jgi:hypothetical protein